MTAVKISRSLRSITRCGCVTERNHPWPTNGATRKYVDRGDDRLAARIDRWSEKIRQLQAELVTVRKALSAHLASHADAIMEEKE